MGQVEAPGRTQAAVVVQNLNRLEKGRTSER